MCSGGNYAAGAMDAAQQTINTVSEMQAAKANRQIIDQASIQRQNEISESGSLQLNETMMQARAQRAHSIAAASGAGVNLGSNSFLASVQTTAMAAANKSQVELENEQNAQTDNTIKTQSELNAKAGSPTFFGWWLQNNMTYLEGAYGGTPQEGAGASADGALPTDPGSDPNNNITPDDDMGTASDGFTGAGANGDESIDNFGGMAGASMGNMTGGD